MLILWQDDPKIELPESRSVKDIFVEDGRTCLLFYFMMLNNYTVLQVGYQRLCQFKVLLLAELIEMKSLLFSSFTKETVSNHKSCLKVLCGKNIIKH